MDKKQKPRPMSDQEKVYLQQVILPVFASSLDGRLTHLGSCFIIYSAGRQALFLSAAHVFQQAFNIEGCNIIHHPTTLQEFITRPTSRNLRSTRLLALFRENIGSGHFVEIDEVYTNNPLDIAVGTIFFPDHVSEEVRFSKTISIDTTPPTKGTPIISAGYGDTKMHVEVDYLQEFAVGTFDFRLDYRHGDIIDVFSDREEARRYGPSFKINTPISSGMSGGPVLNRLYGDQIVACGINTSDFSFDEASDCSGSGQQAIAQMLWPAVSITINHARFNGNFVPVRLLELIRLGFIHDLGNAHEHVMGVPASNVTEFNMFWR